MDSSRLPLVVGSLLLVLLVLTYSNHFDNGFEFDDTHTIVNNLHITEIGNIPSFFTDASTSSTLPANQAYRPMVTTLNAIDHWLAGGLEPFYFHLSIFCWYVVQAILLFFVFERIMQIAHPHRWNRWFALFGTAFYSFHAANAETINYIISRSDSFSTLCVVAALLLYQIPRTRRRHLYLVPMVAGIYTKQTAVMFAPLLFLYVACFEEKLFLRSDDARTPWSRFVRSVSASAPAFVLGVGLFLFNQLALTPATTVSSNTTVSRIDYLFTQFYVVSHYLRNFLLPRWLSADPDLAIIESFGDPRVLGGLLLILLLVAAAAASLRRLETRPIAYGILWFFVALAPTSSIVPLYQIANDHRTFFPYIGLSLCAAWGFALLVVRHEGALTRRRAFAVAAAVVPSLVILAHAAGVRQRNEVWRSGESLWYDVTVKSPSNGRGLMNYGLTQMAKGDYPRALEYFERALDLTPRYSYLHVNLGVVRAAMGDQEKARAHFGDALRDGPDMPAVHYYYARWLNEQGGTAEAVSHLETALGLSPGHRKAASLLATLRDGPSSAAESELARRRRQVMEEPTAAGYVDLAFHYYKADRLEDCTDASRKALELEPRNSAAYNNICAALTRLGELDRAIVACHRALELDPDFRRARANLRWALDLKAGQSPGS